MYIDKNLDLSRVSHLTVIDYLERGNCKSKRGIIIFNSELGRNRKGVHIFDPFRICTKHNICSITNDEWTCIGDNFENMNLAYKINSKRRRRRQAHEINPEYTPPPADLIMQTKRLFYFLSNLNPENVRSPLRSVSILEKSVRIVNSICDPNFLPPNFLKEAFRGFSFFLKEDGTEGVFDVEDEDFNQLSTALDTCLSIPNSITIDGEICTPDLSVEYVRRTINGELQSRAYVPSSDSFKWGKYDVVVDAMWSTVTIVHGICFATFRENINLHHKYQVAMEQLFRNKILFRWSRPLRLKKESEWNNIFLTSVNQSMEVLDACIEGSYISSPFKHRLKRPNNLERRKRSIIDDNFQMSKKLDEFYCIDEKIDIENKFEMERIEHIVRKLCLTG